VRWLSCSTAQPLSSHLIGEGREGERRRESIWREKEVGEGDEEEKEGVCNVPSREVR
jgi:hypothetical protein